MMEPLLRVRVEAAAAELDRVVGIAMELGAQGVEVCDAETHDVPDGWVWVHAWHGAGMGIHPLRAAYGTRLENGEHLEVIEETSTWRDALDDAAPQTLGQRFTVVHAEQSVDPRTPIYIGAGSGFGDGAHPTTQCCVELLESLSTRQPLGEVLDVGTGSGILAIIAAHLGSTSIVATDIDSIARDGAQANVVTNALTEVIHVREDIPIGLVVDLVIANLYYGVLTALLPKLVAATRPGGVCAISGITIDGEGLMVQLMEAHQCFLEQRVERDGWLGLAFRRRTDLKESA